MKGEYGQFQQPIWMEAYRSPVRRGQSRKMRLHRWSISMRRSRSLGLKVLIRSSGTFNQPSPPIGANDEYCAAAANQRRRARRRFFFHISRVSSQSCAKGSVLRSCSIDVRVVARSIRTIRTLPFLQLMLPLYARVLPVNRAINRTVVT